TLTNAFHQQCFETLQNYISKLDEGTQKQISHAQWLYESSILIVMFAHEFADTYNELAMRLFDIIRQIDTYICEIRDFQNLLEDNNVFHITLSNCYNLFPDNDVRSELRY